MIATTVYTVYLFIELILTNGVFTIGSKENLNFEDFYPIFVFASLVFTALPFLFKLNEIVSIILGLPSYFFF